MKKFNFNSIAFTTFGLFLLGISLNTVAHGGGQTIDKSKKADCSFTGDTGGKGQQIPQPRPLEYLDHNGSGGGVLPPKEPKKVD